MWLRPVLSRMAPRDCRSAGEGYGLDVSSGSEPDVPASRPHPFVAAISLVSVVSLNLWFTSVIPAHYPARFNFQSSGIASETPLDTVPFRALWPIECALVIAIVFVLPWCLPVG